MRRLLSTALVAGAVLAIGPKAEAEPAAFDAVDKRIETTPSAPESASLLMLGSGLLGAAAMGRRLKRRNQPTRG